MEPRHMVPADFVLEEYCGGGMWECAFDCLAAERIRMTKSLSLSLSLSLSRRNHFREQARQNSETVDKAQE